MKRFASRPNNDDDEEQQTRSRNDIKVEVDASMQRRFTLFPVFPALPKKPVRIQFPWTSVLVLHPEYCTVHVHIPYPPTLSKKRLEHATLAI